MYAKAGEIVADLTPSTHLEGKAAPQKNSTMGRMRR